MGAFGDAIMGYMRHHAIVVTGPSKEMKKVANKAAKVADEAFYITLVTPPSINDYSSFLVAPDGSKEGWEESEKGDNAREKIKEYLRSLAFSDGSTSFKWVEVQYGDDNHETIIIDHSEKK